MLEDSQDLFNAAIDEDCSNESFKDITHDLARLEDFNLTVVHLEVFFERVANVSVKVILLVQLLLLLLELPLWESSTLASCSLRLTLAIIVVGIAWSALLIQDVLLNAKESNQLCEEVVLGQ